MWATGPAGRRAGLLGVLALSLLAPAAARGAQRETRPTVAPTFVTEGVTRISETDAGVEAMIDTHGGYTGYEFQVDTTGAFDFTGPACPFALPGTAQCDAMMVGETMPGGALPEPRYIQGSSTPTIVRVDLSSIGVKLAPATTYHFRVIADGYGGETPAPDLTFATPGGVPQGAEPAPAAPGGQAEPPVTSPPMGPEVESPAGAGSSREGGKATHRTRRHTARAGRARAARKLARALKVCRRRPAAHRHRCVHGARATYRRRIARLAQRGIVKSSASTRLLRPSSLARTRSR